MGGSVDERFALLQVAISERADTEQIRETISNELRNVVRESQDCRGKNISRCHPGKGREDGVGIGE